MSEYHTMYHDGYAKAFFIETPGHERLAIFPYGRDQGDVALDVAKDAASKALDFFNGQINRAHPGRYFVECSCTNCTLAQWCFKCENDHEFDGDPEEQAKRCLRFTPIKKGGEA